MGNVLSALWYREMLLYRRHILTSGLLPLITGHPRFMRRVDDVPATGIRELQNDVTAIRQREAEMQAPI